MNKQQWIEKWGYIIPFEALQFLEAMAEDAFAELEAPRPEDWNAASGDSGEVR